MHFLCLSNGNYDGLGKTRANEMINAVNILVTNAANKQSNESSRIIFNTKILDDDRLQDGPLERWDEKIIESVVEKYIHEEILSSYSSSSSLSNQSSSLPPSSSSLLSREDVTIITFDDEGVSNHPNHIDTNRGVLRLLIQSPHQSLSTYSSSIAPNTTITTHDNNNEYDLTILTLDTIRNPFTKYFPWYILLKMFLFSQWWKWPYQKQTPLQQPQPHKPQHPQYHHETFEPKLAWNAMAAHDSQFVWYRRLSVLFSMYTYANDLTLVGNITTRRQGQNRDDNDDGDHVDYNDHYCNVVVNNNDDDNIFLDNGKGDDFKKHQ